MNNVRNEIVEMKGLRDIRVSDVCAQEEKEKEEDGMGMGKA